MMVTVKSAAERQKSYRALHGIGSVDLPKATIRQIAKLRARLGLSTDGVITAALAALTDQKKQRKEMRRLTDEILLLRNHFRLSSVVRLSDDLVRQLGSGGPDAARPQKQKRN